MNVAAMKKKNEEFALLQQELTKKVQVIKANKTTISQYVEQIDQLSSSNSKLGKDLSAMEATNQKALKDLTTLKLVLSNKEKVN